jgi:hypothetical protein
MRDVDAASDLLKPYDARLMRCYPMSARVNSVVNDDEECSGAVEPAQIQEIFSVEERRQDPVRPAMFTLS